MSDGPAMAGSEGRRAQCKAFCGSDVFSVVIHDQVELIITIISVRESIMENTKDLREVVELSIEELEERTAPGTIINF